MKGCQNATCTIGTEFNKEWLSVTFTRICYLMRKFSDSRCYDWIVLLLYQITDQSQCLCFKSNLRYSNAMSYICCIILQPQQASCIIFSLFNVSLRVSLSARWALIVGPVHLLHLTFYLYVLWILWKNKIVRMTTIKSNRDRPSTI